MRVRESLPAGALSTSYGVVVIHTGGAKNSTSASRFSDWGVYSLMVLGEPCAANLARRSILLLSTSISWALTLQMWTGNYIHLILLHFYIFCYTFS